MGNFASSDEWLYSEEMPCQHHIITPKSASNNNTSSKTNNNRPSALTKPAMDASTSDLVALLVARAITTCKQSVHDVLSRAVGSVYSTTDTESESDELDDIFDEFQIVYEDNYERLKAENTKRTSENDLFKDAPWFQYCPSDFQTIPIGDTVSLGKWEETQTQTSKVTEGKDHKNETDEDARSATTESTDWLSDACSDYDSDNDNDSDDKSENPASSVSSYCGSEMDESVEYFDDDDDVETKASCLLRLASTCGEDVILFVDDYLCQCGQCPQYKLIEDDVCRVVTWRDDPEELLSIARILQAFSTYNEAVGYHPEMIAAVDECLRMWDGDEDQAFSSFVVLQDEVPYLCGRDVV